MTVTYIHGGEEAPAHRGRGDQDEAPLAPPYEIRRRGWLFALIGVLALGLGGGYAWLAYDRDEPLYYAAAGALALVALLFLWALRDIRVPLLVADEHGLRLLDRDGWAGYLWREMALVEVVPAKGVSGAHVLVVGPDGDEHRVPLGFSTSSKIGRTGRELARRQALARP